MDKAGKEVGVDFVGGFSALVHKGASKADHKLMDSIPRPVRHRQRVLVGERGLHARASTWTPCSRMAGIIKATAEGHSRPPVHRCRQAGGVLQRRGGTTPSWPVRSTARAGPTKW